MLQLSIRQHVFGAFPKSSMDKKEELWCRTTFESHIILLVGHNFCTGDIFDAVIVLSSSCLTSLYTLLSI